MELVYVVKAVNVQGENGRWGICENTLPEQDSPETKEKVMEQMAMTLVEKLIANGWKITSQEVGMLHDDRSNYDFMSYFGNFQPPMAMNIIDKKVYPDE